MSGLFDIPIQVVHDVDENHGREQPQVNLSKELLLESLELLLREASEDLGHLAVLLDKRHHLAKAMVFRRRLRLYV